jgi:hypothetical protein
MFFIGKAVHYFMASCAGIGNSSLAMSLKRTGPRYKKMLHLRTPPLKLI